MLFQTPLQNSALNLNYIVIMKIRYVKYATRYDNFVSYIQINRMDTWIPGISVSVRHEKVFTTTREKKSS